MQSKRAPLLLATWVVLLPACSGQPLPKPRPHPPAPPADLAAPFVSPARWAYHPALPTEAITFHRLARKACIFTAEGGQRWLTTPTPEKKTSPPDADADADAASPATPDEETCEGTAQISPEVAPEELPDIIHHGDRSWLFVGASGALYEAPEPLAPFTRTIAPPEPLASLAGDGDTILAATYTGKILRYRDESGWQPVPSPPPNARVLDVAVDPSGRALALAFPEALFTSADGGSTWLNAGVPSIGARSVGVTRAGDLLAVGALVSLAFPRSAAPAPAAPTAGTPRSLPPPTRVTYGLPTTSPTLALEAQRTPAASAIAAGRAVLDGDRYAELIRPEDEGEPWLLARGRLEGRLEVTKLPNSDTCGSMHLGARGKNLVTVCVSSDGGEIAATVRRSLDGGETWGEPLALVTADTDQIAVAVSPEGNALVTGVCRITAEGSSACKPGAPLLIRPDGAKLKAVLTGAPQLSGLALSPAFAFDGRSAYFLGRRGKDDLATLFVSHDSGMTFADRPLTPPAPSAVKAPARDDDEDSREEEGGDDAVEIDESSYVRPGDEGTLGLSVTRSRGPGYMTADEDGRVLGVATAPTEGALIGGVGLRVIATASADDNGPDGEPIQGFWESPDGGATWEPTAAPRALARESARAPLGIACSSGGCLLGDAITRTGWGGAPTSSAPEPLPDTASSPGPDALTPIVCDLAPTTRWSRIDHPVRATATIAELPDVVEAMRGRSAWSVLTHDPATGAVSAVSATLPEGGEGEARVTARALLGARPPRLRAGLHLSPQMEGYAVARVTFPEGADGKPVPGTPMRNVEVAWENYMEGSSGRGRIPDAGKFEEVDVQRTSGEPLFDAQLVTVTVHGLVIVPHSPRSKGAGAFLVDPSGRVEKVKLPEFPSQGPSGSLDVHTEALLASGKLLGVGIVRVGNGDANAILLARPLNGTSGSAGFAEVTDATGAWGLNALAVGPLLDGEEPLTSHVDWTYVGTSSIGVTSFLGERLRGRGFAYFHELRADGSFGAPLPLPTLRDLGDRPRACSAADRAGSPRYEALFSLNEGVLFPGMRHPVLVGETIAGATKAGAATGGPGKSGKGAAFVSAPLTLLTGSAVAHGSPASPCVAAWEAKSLGRGGEVHAIISGDLARSWLFRVVPVEAGRSGAGGAGGTASIEYRPMSCRFDPGARVPDAVWKEPGMSRIER